jgi:endoglucanase
LAEIDVSTDGCNIKIRGDCSGYRSREIVVKLRHLVLPALFMMTAASVLRASALAESPASDAASGLSMLHSDGCRIMDASDRQVVLKGCDLGNYLMLESWMLGGCIQQHGEDFRDQATLLRTFTSRFGADRTNDLMNAYRAGYIQRRDFEIIKSFHFNTVRLPFDYRLLQEDQPPFHLKRDAFRWLDHALDMAEAEGVYVILDMHGAPGGQSNQHHTGEAGQNHFWNSEVNYQRTIAIWRAIAERYKDRPVVAAYDLLNEPYGDFKSDVRPELARVIPRICQAIRDTGDQHLVFFPGALNAGIVFYGNPSKRFKNVGFTEHFYPGLFGSTPALESQARTLNLEFPVRRAYLQSLGAPYFVGEFNVVLDAEDAPRTMRAYYDRCAEYGWAATMWSYKMLKPAGGTAADSWYMATNAQPLPKLDLDTSSYESFADFFGSFGKIPLAINEPLRDDLTTDHPAPLYLSNFEPLQTTVPATPQSEPPGYESTDLGDAPPGHTAVQADGSLIVFAGGSDVNATSDSCQFISRTAHTPLDLRATISSFLYSNEYAKAGVMARWGDGPGAAMTMVNVFPDGSVAMMNRAREGAGTTEIKSSGTGLPVEVRLEVTGGRAVGSYRRPGSRWQRIGASDAPEKPNCRAGAVVCAHTDVAYTRVQMSLDEAADAAINKAATAALPQQNSLLTNGSFEEPGAQPDEAAGWNRWGEWMNRESNWSPVHSGSALIGYHHWQVENAGSSGLWQEVKVQARKRYFFSIYAQHDQVDPSAHEAKSLELRMESVTPGGQLTLNSKNFDVATLPITGRNWAHLSICGTAESDSMRVLVVINSADTGPRDGAIKLDDASLCLAPGYAAAPAALPSGTAAADDESADETAIPDDAIAHLDLVYARRGERDMKLDLFTPPGAGPFPLVIWIHGGAWYMGSKATYTHMMFLLRHGFAVANIEYRFSQVAPFPAQIDDCESALDFLTAQAATYHLDPDRIAATGESAGGHLASLLGMDRSARRATPRPDSLRGRIRAVFDLAGPSDLADFDLHTKDAGIHHALEQLLGGPPDQRTELAREASPIAHVSGDDPPFLIFHGTADPVVPFSQSQHLADALKRAGVDVELVPIPNGGHGGPAFWVAAKQEKILAFLRRTMAVR